MWEDYMSLLSYFGKDMRNAHYVCPKNLKTAHDKLLKIKQVREARLRQERDRAQSISKREKLMKDIAGFYERMEKFFGLRIEEEDIIIRLWKVSPSFIRKVRPCTIVCIRTDTTDGRNA